MTKPYIFDEFFASGLEESISPFLTPGSRKWGKNLPLKSAALSAVLLLLAGAASFFHPTLSSILLVSVYFLVGTPALIGTIHDLRNLEINIDVLMTCAALLSVLIGSALEGALLLVLFELSAAIENAVTQKTKSALVSLNRLSPRTGWLILADGTLNQRAIRDIVKGDRLLVKAGEIVPLDGIVLEGKSSVNLAHLTGESLPLFKERGDELPAGALNLEGALTLEVTRTAADSTLSRIINLITHAQSAKPKLSRFIDRFGKRYAAVIMLLFFGFATTLPLFTSLPYLGPEGGIYRALSFLIAASPCALVIATPTAYLSAISSCAKRGILLKGGVILDALAHAKGVAFDKTGTLTTGKLICASFSPLTEKMRCSQDTALAIAYAMERNAVHPIAEAIVSLAKEKGVSPHPLESFKSIPGAGLEAKVRLSTGECLVALGSRDFILSQNPTLALPQPEAGHLFSFLLVDETLFHFRFIDAIRENAREAVQALKDQNLQLTMLTGDHLASAAPVASLLKLDRVFADLRPEDKLAKIAELAEKEGIIMVGDGVNDAPALARSTVGISLGRVASATAVDASDVVLLKEDLSLLPWLISKARKTHSIIKQNLTLSLGVILLATTPALLGIVPLWAAVLLHEGGTMLVGLNSLRLLKTR
ncbi:MAG: heavy metal translocating P-type ATPase [Chlamydiales bacterium]